MSATLRDYQHSAVTRCLPLLPKGVVLTIATGGGKTICGVAVARLAARRVLWLAHRRELIFQARDAARDAGARVGVVLAGEPDDSEAPFQVASVQTIGRRSLPTADLLVVDECHHATTHGQYARAMRRYGMRLGLTATPARMDGRGLRAAGFGALVVGATASDLCEMGVLHAPIVYGSTPPDMTGAKVRRGDFAAADLRRAAETSALTGRVVEQWARRAEGRRTVVFAVDVQHARDLCARFRAAGVAAEVVTGATKKPERDAMLSRLSSGASRVLVNVGVLAEGWDLPSLQVASIARPTASVTFHVQMIGRIMRACPGKDGALVLDHAGNHHRHGFVTDERRWSLDHKPRVSGGAPTRTCDRCERVCAAGCHACPECGQEFPLPDRTSESDRDLELLADWRVAGFDVRTATSAEWDDARAAWRERGRRNGWPPGRVAWFVRECESIARRGTRAVEISA